jgi:hypothetical protein
MLKKDAIFWSASAISIAAVVIFIITQNQSWLTLMIGSYLLRPTMASLGVGRKKIDERQMTIHYRSGNIAFAVMMIASVIGAVMLYTKGDQAFELFAMAIIAGLATKALFNVILVKNYSEAASKIIISIGLLVALFGFLEGSPPITDKLVDALPGLLFAGVGLLSKKYPRPIGVVIFIATACLIAFIFSRGFSWGQIVTAIVIGVPMILAGLCLFKKNVDNDASTSEQAT